MPEGDTLYHYAERLRPFLKGRTIERADSRWPARVGGLAGVRVLDVESVGKHLLIAFADAPEPSTLRIHLGMKGSVHRYDVEERWRRPFSEMSLVLETAHDVIVGFFFKELDRFATKARAQHRPLAQLGPDLLRDADLDEVTARTREIASGEEAIALCLLDQRVACGIGNVYKCEALFLEGHSPFKKVSALDDGDVRALYARAAQLMLRNIRPTESAWVGMRTTSTRKSEPHYVYDRAGKPCLECGVRVQCENQSDLTREYTRLTWWCPRCQPD